MLSPVSIESSPLMNLWFQVQHSPFWTNWVLLLRRSLNLCLCTTWFFKLGDLVKINTLWLYKEPKVSVLQENALLV